MAGLIDEVQDTLSSLRERMGSALPARREPRDVVPGGRTTSMAPRVFRVPDVDVEETDDAVIVRAELPGLRPEDFSVEISGDRVVLRGEKREERTDQNGDFTIRERRYGSFLRTVPLPSGVDREAAEAEYRDGVLRLRLPRLATNPERRAKIPVRAA